MAAFLHRGSISSHRRGSHIASQGPAPLTAVIETVKSISLEDFGSGDKAFFQRYFFDFIGTDRPNTYADHAAAGLEKAATRFSHDQDQQPRRFSLGTGLSRGQYYAVCQDSDGNSGQTLAMEILNYASVTSPHVIEIVDLKDPTMGRFRDTLSESETSYAAAEGWRILLVQVLTIGSPAGNPDRRLIPYRLRSIERNAAFDLRSREALEWLFATLNDDWPNAIFLTAASKNDVDFDKVDAATGGDGPPLIGFESAALSYDEKSALLAKLQSIEPAKFWSRGLSQSRDARMNSYSDLFAYLLAPESGGNLLTTLIATYLHYLGADAIIFPSARENCSASKQGHTGFNLVDFAGIERKPPAIYIVEEPGFFARRRSSKLEWEGAPMTTLEGPVYPTASQWGNGHWAWAVKNHRSVTIGRHRWWVLKNYLNRTFPDYKIPRLLVGQTDGEPDSWPTPREFDLISDILCGVFDGTLKLSDRAWGFHWVVEFEAATHTLGEWLAEFASRHPFFGAQQTHFRFDGVRALYSGTPGSSSAASFCVCCGWEDTQPESAKPAKCPSCGF